MATLETFAGQASDVHVTIKIVSGGFVLQCEEAGTTEADIAEDAFYVRSHVFTTAQTLCAWLERHLSIAQAQFIRGHFGIEDKDYAGTPDGLEP